jgi:transcriptional regulator with XRE-family HTH domain
MAKVEFFISYAGADQAWAGWIAWQLEAAGHTTRLQAWDFSAGSDFVHQMQRALRDAKRLVAVLSPAYLTSRFGEAEWRPIFAKDPTGERRLLLPVRVAECDPPELLTTRVYVDLVGLAEAEATEQLLAAVRQEPRPGRPHTAPVFPGAAAPGGLGVQPPFPGPGPSISNLASRNPHFTGRTELLERLEAELAGGVAAVVAAHGLGGVGKTQLALEYAHRHAGDYQLIWWVPAETRLLATASLAELARRLGLPARTGQAEQAAAALAALAGQGGWLLVFDNADAPTELEGLWPAGGGGRVLVTSRNPGWGGLAARMEVDVLAAQEAVAFLLARTRSGDRRAAEALASELGGLPLALEQASAYLEATGISLADYLDRYRRYHAELLARGQPTWYSGTVATTWQLNLEQLANKQAAGDLLRLCAFLGPEPIPPSLLTADPMLFPPELAAAVGDELALDEVIAAVYRFSLLGRDHDGLRLHRLVSEVVRARLDLDTEQRWAATAVALVATGFPTELFDQGSWPAAARLLPHALAATNHAERLQVAVEDTSHLLNLVGRYLDRRRAETPEVARRRLRVALRRARETNGRTQEEVAQTMEWSVSKLSRIESGAVGISAVDLRGLLHFYDVTDAKRVQELIDLARGSRKQSWAGYTEVYSQASLNLFGSEGAASAIYSFVPMFVPDLLQTQEYAQALLTAQGHSGRQLELMADVRIQRQELLDRDPQLKLHFILGEAALSWAVGGRRVMLRQLERIKELGARSGISIQVLPFSAGAPAYMAGTFTILEFAGESDDDLLYLESASGEHIARDEPQVLSNYWETFAKLEDIATKPGDLADVLESIEAQRFKDGTDFFSKSPPPEPDS